MSITYQVEPWETAYPEMAVYWHEHWKEVATHQEAIPLNPDVAWFETLARQGQLHVVTVRQDGALIGYHMAVLRGHPHYKHSLTAFTDAYYVHPEHRKGLVGYKLFQHVERTLKARGVERIYTGTKRSLDMSHLFERLGWQHTEQLFVKYLGPADPPGELWEIDTLQDPPS
jgi:GNAT superfamily N-acetyltransferase